MTVCAEHQRWTHIENADGSTADRDCPECQKRPSRVVHVRRGQFALIECRAGVALALEHFASGAVILRNANTGGVIRSWAPKDKDGR